MHEEPTTIHFSTALIYLPIKLETQKDSIRDIYHELSKVANCDYDDISFDGFPIYPPKFIKKQGKTVSSCVFQRDRVIIIEDCANITLEEFSQRIQEVLIRSFRLLSINFLVMQICTIKCLFTPLQSQDARIFLGENACNLKGKILPHFKRKPQLFGIRFMFPPAKDMLNYFSTKMESYNQDSRKIYVETTGTFPLAKPITATNIDNATANMRTTYDFCGTNVKEFLNQFDKKGGI